LLYARYSTEEQDASSNPDQFAYNRRFLLDENARDANIEELSDSELSGELVSRPGINKVREGIAARRWDLIVVEDTSRLFRHVTACGQLVESAVDQGIRVIAINDAVDPAEEDWEDRLHDVARHHARSNTYTAKRIKRKLDALWSMGAAVGLLLPGFRRTATNPGAEKHTHRGPYYDAIDPNRSAVIYQAYERIARGEPVWVVAQFLTTNGLPKSANAKTSEWSEPNVLALIKNTIYRGEQRYRYTVVQKKRGSGEHLQVRNDPSAVLIRPMPHLRIVPDWLWYQANQAIQNRRTRGAIPTGKNHPLAGIPRDSRGPLAGIMHCAPCGGKMIVDGRREGGYRCRNARKGTCWNKASPLRSLVHAQLSKAIAEQLLALDGVLDALVAHVQGLLADDGRWNDRHTLLQRTEQKLRDACEKLEQAIENGEPPASLVDRLKRRQDELAQVRAEREKLEAERNLPLQLASKEAIREKVQELAARLLDLDRAVRPDLQRLVSIIHAVPYQQFGTSNVVLRAQFQLRLAALLPDQILSLLEQDAVEAINGQGLTVPMTVDLFAVTQGPARYWEEALNLANQGWNMQEIAAALGTNRATANRAVRYGRALIAAGLSDPFVALTGPPMKTGRWRVHPRLQQHHSSGSGEEGAGEREEIEGGPPGGGVSTAG
jgi:hypothetical protein